MKIRKKVLLIIMALLLTITIITETSGLINEIMYDPPGPDNNKEYVEILIDSNRTLDNIIIGDESNDTLTLLTIIRNQTENQNITENNTEQNQSENQSTNNKTHNTEEKIYCLIVEEGFNYSQLTTDGECRIYSAGATIGNNLGNEGDTIRLWINGTIYDEVTYYGSGCSSGKGCSLEKNDSGWFDSPPGGSPCLTNKIINEDNKPSGNITINISSTNETENKTEDDKINKTTECDNNLSIVLNKKIINSGETIEYRPIIKSQLPYNITYWWEDIYGEIIRQKRITSNNNKKTYTPKIKSKEKTIILKMILKTECGGETLKEEMVAVKNPDYKEGIQTTANANSHKVSDKEDLTLKDNRPVLEAKIPEKAVRGENFTVEATLTNKGIIHSTFMVWAYAYRGSKSYSGPREQNMRVITIPPLSSKKVTLPLSVNETGNYLIKIKALNEGRKTPYEIRGNITIEVKEGEKKETKEKNNITENKPANDKTVENYIKKDEITNKITGETTTEITDRKEWIKKNSAWISTIIAGIAYLIHTFTKRH